MDDDQRFAQLHKWAARKAGYIQPDLNVIDVTPVPKKFSFKYGMSPGKRIDLFLISSVMLLIGLALLTCICLFMYLLISASL